MAYKELEELHEMVKRNKDNAQNGIIDCRRRIQEIEKEMSYYEGQRDEAASTLHDIEESMKGKQLPTPVLRREEVEK
jgi:hypothetical protein